MTAATQLADARRTLGLSLDDIATRTKVGVERLAAIEAVDLRGLPSHVYLKGFVRAYAAEVGLDADATADRYITELTDDAALTSSGLSSGVYIMPTMEESLEAFESEGPDADAIAPLHASRAFVAARDNFATEPGDDAAASAESGSARRPPRLPTFALSMNPAIPPSTDTTASNMIGRAVRFLLGGMSGAGAARAASGSRAAGDP